MSETENILIGYEVGSGKPVSLRLHHLAIFGMTRLSGKTTALEALITRAHLKAIAFITKRGEAGFSNANLIKPYYKPRSDWQFVEGLVNVALGEKVKYEPGMRYAIMKVCRGRKDLKEIQLEARRLSNKDKSSFMRSVYEKLDAYLEIVIPELDKWVFTDKLTLSEGINVMDLSQMRLETQHIVIASTIEYAFTHLDHTVAIIPEAWETLPQGKMTPVKWVAQQFIRKGAALGNYLWLDSQDIGGIDKTPLRQCDNWLMGRMKEAHEVERILKQLLGLKVPKEEIQTLPLGHFYAAIGNEVKKLYALPIGVPEEIGKQVALGTVSPESVREQFMSKQNGDEEMYKEKFEEAQRTIRELEERLKTLEKVENVQQALKEMMANGKQETIAEPLEGKGQTLNLEHAELIVNVSHTEKVIQLSTDHNQQGQIMYVILNDLPKDGFTEVEVSQALLERGWNIGHNSLAPHLATNLPKQGLIIKLDNTRPTKYRLPLKVKINVQHQGYLREGSS